LAEGLRSLPPDSRELNAPGAVDAYVLHDSADAGQGPIRLPLRRMPPELVQSELAGFDTAGRRSTKPRSDLLDGYLYEQVDSHWELTGFGHGMRTLFPRRPEILGG
jgi:hypothetical protein